MVGALPGAVEREMALDPLGAQGEGGEIDADAQVMPRKPDGLDAAVEFFLQAPAAVPGGGVALCGPVPVFKAVA